MNVNAGFESYDWRFRGFELRRGGYDGYLSIHLLGFHFYVGLRSLRRKK